MPEPKSNTITVTQNGPLGLSGELELNGQKSNELWLCRCGQSQKKPFCDGSHKASGFADPGTPVAGDVSLAAVPATLKVTAAKDGPLLINGSFRVVSSAGIETSRGTKAALCRCGFSKNKPFCDGAHKAAGFTAP